MTHDTLLGSPLRYALTVTGSLLPPDPCQKVDTRIVKVAARKAPGVDRTARIETLHFVAGAYNFKNLVVMHLAEHLELMLRAHNRSAQKEAERAMCRVYRVPNIQPEIVKIRILA